MSKIRPELVSGGGSRCPDYSDGLYMIRDSVRRRSELIAGKIDDEFDRHCAVGAFFADNKGLALKSDLVDEVAMYNDSIKTSSLKVRRNKVLQWLNWKLKVLANRAPAGLRILNGGKRAA